MFGSKKDKAAFFPEDRVSLKPLLGLRPGIYLSVLYAALLTAILFFILLYPGLTRPGSRVTFTSQPEGAAVRVDDTYRGTTPCTVFVASGDHDVVMVLPGFSEFSVRQSVPGRLFGSALVPRRLKIEGRLPTADPVGVLTLGAADYARWSFSGSPSETYQVPLVISEAAYRGAGAAKDADAAAAMDAVLRAAARFATSGTALRDLTRARFTVDAAGQAPSPVTVLRSAKNVVDYLASTPGAAAWLAAHLDKEAAARVSASAWFAGEQKIARAIRDQASAAASVYPALPDGVRVGNRTYREIPAGKVILEGSYPLVQTTGAFRIADAETTENDWQAFVAEQPEWSLANKDALIRQGVVDSEYLLSVENAQYPVPAVPGVSWYAAEAYCRWQSAKLPPAWSNHEVRLPTEAEWQRAAMIDATPAGGLWEWCAEPYAPLAFLPADPQAVKAVSSPERPVRGGSWANPAGTVTPQTRASLPPKSCSPFVGFRPVLAPKRALP